MIGTPEQVIEKLHRFQADYACTDFILSTHFAGINPQKSARSNELFARQVIPEFRA
jgi:alkanesulfonate monooxygenase SsuD/methylene tetrahydromethanopterin reductase-like flavin-dependent oxidoreductase (luciferase family)